MGGSQNLNYWYSGEIPGFSCCPPGWNLNFLQEKNPFFLARGLGKGCFYRWKSVGEIFLDGKIGGLLRENQEGQCRDTCFSEEVCLS